MSARQLTREEWIRRFGWHRGLSLSEAHAQGRRLGGGMFGEVHEAANDRSMAIKYQRPRPIADVEREVDIQAYLGNELGLMPAVRAVEIEPNRNSYVGMDNLAKSGYETLESITLDPSVTDVERARLRAEASLASAWAARAGIKTGDFHEENIMALRGRAEPDGSRVKLIDPGYYKRITQPVEIIHKQAEDLMAGYRQIGLEHMGRSISQLVDELTMENNLPAAASVIADALSDLAARQESLTEAAFKANLALGDKLRMAGDIFKAPLDDVNPMPQPAPPVAAPRWKAAFGVGLPRLNPSSGPDPRENLTREWS